MRATQFQNSQRNATAMYRSLIVTVILITGIIAVTSLGALAQDPKGWEKEGGIPNAEIEIVKDKKVNLPPADRNFQKIAPRPAEPVRHDIVYDYKNLSFNTSDYSPVIRPLKLKQEDIAKIYGNYVSGGVGNYASPYLEAYFNSRRDKNRFYGAHFYHHSFGTGPVDGKNSASGRTEFNLFGRAISDVVTASGQLDYSTRSGYFYGYAPGTEPDRSTIKQIYNTIGFTGAVENTKVSDFNYKIQAGYNHLDSRLSTSENEFSATAAGAYTLSEKTKINVGLEYYGMSRKDSTISYKGRNLFKVKPSVKFSPIENLSVDAGVNVAVEDDNGSKVHFYPNVKADYNIAESVIVWAVLTGDIDKVNLHTLSRDNMWLANQLSIEHTNRQAEFMGGLRGKLSPKIAFGTGASVATLHNLYSYHNSISDRAKLDITYNNTSRFNLFGELGYSAGENAKMTLRGEVFSYTTEAVYHRPRYKVAYTSSFNVFDKLWFNVDLIAQGGMKAYNYDETKIVTLPAAFDLNAKADYFFSRRVSAFLKFNNILSNKYQVYLNYPVRGLQVMGGVTCTF